MEELAIVILNYNGRDYLEKFLPSLVSYSKPHSIYVADNASTDDSVNYIKDNQPEVKIILLDENHGYAGGYNMALRQIEAKYFILVNSDVEVTPNWTEPLLQMVKSNPEVVACQPKIKSYQEKDYFEYAGAAGGYIDWLGFPFCKGRIFDYLEKDEGQYDNNDSIFWSSGACFLIRKDIFHNLGELDKHFFAHMEEIDLCWRIQNAGYTIKYCYESIIYHVGGGTLNSTNPKKTYLNFRNGLLLLVKNLPFWNLFFKIPIRSFLDLIAICKFIVDGNAAHGIAIIKAHLHAAPMALRYIFNKRNKKSKNANRFIYKKLIVLQYFLYKRTKYSDLNIN